MTVGHVLERTAGELLGLRNFGRKSYDELRDKLVELEYIDGNAPGLSPISDLAGDDAMPLVSTGSAGTVAPGVEEDEEGLGALGKALKEALREVGDDDLLTADDED